MLLTNLLVLRSLRSRPLRTLLGAFGIVLGVASMLAIGITNLTALDSVTRLFKNTSGNANLIVINSDSTRRGFNDRTLRRVSNLTGIETAIPTVQVKTLLADQVPVSEIGFNFFGASMGGLTIYGIDPELDGKARKYEIAEGRFLVKDRTAYEVVLVKGYAEEEGIKVGNWIEILSPNGIDKLKVVGLMTKDGPGQINNGAFGVIPIKTAQEIFGRMGDIDQIDIVVGAAHTSSAALEELRASVEERLGKDFSVIYPASQGRRMTQMLGSYQIGLNFLSGIALFVGAFLIYNSFAMTVVERTREFGMLRTVGMTRRQVIQQVALEALMLGVVGSILGAGLGVVISRGLTKLMEIMMGQEMGTIQVALDVLITSLVVGVVVTLLAAFIPAWQAGRVSPLEALRVRGVARDSWLILNGWKIGAGLLLVSTVILIVNPFPYDVQFRLGSFVVFSLFVGATLMIPASVGIWERITRPIVRRVYGNSGRLGSSNVQRAKLRTTLTVAALMIGVAMILIVRGMTESFSGDLKEWINAYIGGDLYVSSSVTMRQDVARRLEMIEGVAAVAPIRYLEVKWAKPEGGEEDLSLMAIEPALHSRVTSFVYSDKTTDPGAAMKRLAAGDAVFISSVLSEKHGLGVGDSIRLRTRIGFKDFEIAAVVVDFYNQGQVIEGSWGDMRRYFRINDATAYMLKVQDGFSTEGVQTRIDDLYGARDRLTIESNRDIKERISQLMDQAFVMFDVLALIAMLVASLGVVNTLTMNVMERTQEIGMLRSIGMTRPQVVQMVLAEAGLMGLIGGLLGLVLGIILSRIFMVSMATMSGYDLTYVFPIQGIIVGLFIALFVSQIAAILPARRAAMTRILDAIHYE